MAWSMHSGHHDDEAQTRWHRPPAVEEGQAASIHAPTATALLGERSSAGSDSPAER